MRSINEPLAVSITTGVLELTRSSRHRLRPSSPGSITSSTIKSITFSSRRRRILAVGGRGHLKTRVT